jgi:hypothetical protein
VLGINSAASLDASVSLVAGSPTLKLDRSGSVFNRGFANEGLYLVADSPYEGSVRTAPHAPSLFCQCDMKFLVVLALDD